jgi:hypothetical protein
VPPGEAARRAAPCYLPLPPPARSPARRPAHAPAQCKATKAGDRFCTPASACPGGGSFDTSVCYKCDDDCRGAVSPSPATLAVVYDERRCADGAVGADEVAAFGGKLADSGCVLVPVGQALPDDDGEDGDTDDDE